MQKIKSIKKICLILSSILGLSAAETVDNFSGNYFSVGILNSQSKHDFYGNIAFKADRSALGAHDTKTTPPFPLSTTDKTATSLMRIVLGTGKLSSSNWYAGVELFLDTNFNKKTTSKNMKVTCNGEEISNNYISSESESSTYYTDYGYSIRLGYAPTSQTLIYCCTGLTSDFKTRKGTKDAILGTSILITPHIGMGLEFAITPQHHINLNYIPFVNGIAC